MVTISASTLPTRFDLLGGARHAIATAIIACCANEMNTTLSKEVDERLRVSINRIGKRGSGYELQFSCSSLCKSCGNMKPQEIAARLASALCVMIKTSMEFGSVIAQVVAQGTSLVFALNAVYAGGIINAILHDGFLKALPQTRDRVMVEYSQPNSHKAFHVGHMRNAALGDSLVRLYEHFGFPVVAVNYFGDEGAHVAKCLWLLLRRLKERGISLSELDVPIDRKGEYLGLIYAEAVDMLDLASLTSLPYEHVLIAKVLSIKSHPSVTAPKSWHVVEVQYTSAGDINTVVCGGEGYEVGDLVAYVPINVRFNKNAVVSKDMQGITSSGIIVAYDELGETPPPAAVEKALAIHATTASAEVPLKTSKMTSKEKKKNKKKKEMPKLIRLVQCDQKYIGTPIAELGRLADAKGLDANSSVTDEFVSRKNECNAVLRALEDLEPTMCALWNETKSWSINEFKDIYKWLGVRFDHDFYESEVGEESKRLVMDAFERGILEKDHGAIGARLDHFNLPFAVLLKSDGAGLYATKDLALAHRKFREFHINRSIYVVDHSQELHFKQVFKTLELMGYDQAKNCYHLKYGLVQLPEGKMSSRKGTVIYFSDLRQQLETQINREFLCASSEDSRLDRSDWSDEERTHALRAISVSTIKYKMLDVDPIKTITFDIKEWTAKKGNTGPYLMYGYARIRAILKKVSSPVNGRCELKLLDTARDRFLLVAMSRFWQVLEKCTDENNPSTMCKFAYELSREFMSWYDVSSVVHAETPDLQATRLALVGAVAEVLKTSMNLLGMIVIERM